MKNFRHFVIEKWFEHKDEILLWTKQPLTEYNDAYYFKKHRWLLKKMYKEENKINNSGENVQNG